MRSARGRLAPQSRLSASSTVAASELPPPRPPPNGMRLATRDVDAERAPVACLRAAAARTARSSCGATPRNSVVRTIAPSSRQVSVIVSPTSMRDEQRLEQVVAVVAAARHVQEQVELRRRGNGQPAHRIIVAARGSDRRGSRGAPAIDDDAQLEIVAGEPEPRGQRAAPSAYA